jgi:serine/threonine protein kinase
MIGEIVSKYRVIEEIGAGSMGTVYKAQDTFLGRFAALKLIAEKYLGDREALLRFEREGQAASGLVHPNICTVFDFGRWRNRPYLAMEWLAGTTLSQRIEAGRLNADEVRNLAIPILGALEAAHKAGIVHRDIKPANLFLTTRGVVKVLDFGLAKMKHRYETLAPGEDMPTVATFVTMPGTILGTLAYMSPEQVRSEPVDGRADLYSLGVVLYELCTGKLPLRGAPMDGLPPSLARIVEKAMELDRNARYRDAAEMREALTRM